MSVETIPFDGTEFMGTLEAQAYLLTDAMESGDPVYIRHALNTIARARGMTLIAEQAGVAREALYRALSPEGDPRMSTLFGVFNALGLRMSVAPIVLAGTDESATTKLAAMAAAGALRKIPGGKRYLNKRYVAKRVNRYVADPVVEKDEDAQVEYRSSKKAKGTPRRPTSATLSG